LVVMLDFLNEAGIEKVVLKDVAEVVTYNMQYHNEPLPETAKDAVGVLAWHLLTYDRPMLESLAKTKVLVRVGIGIDTVDLKAAGELGIYVANVPDYGVEEVADSAMNHILNLMRRTFQVSYQMNNGELAIEKAQKATRLRGKNLGLVGFGKIGKATAIRAKAHGLNVIFFDPLLEDGHDKALGTTRVDSLKELIESSDVLSLHCWLDSKNANMINRETLSWIKGGKPFYFVNTARGGLVDESALLEAIKDGRISGAALDVTQVEPYPKNGPLLDKGLQNVVVTPHSAFLSAESFVEMRQKAAMEIKRVLQGGQPRNWVNKQYFKNPRV